MATSVSLSNGERGLGRYGLRLNCHTATRWILMKPQIETSASLHKKPIGPVPILRKKKEL